MQPIAEEDVRLRISRDNPWWQSVDDQIPEARFPRRVYFPTFKALALNFGIRRATVLLGPRRVGKTFMIKQLIHEAILSGINPKNILYVSVDTPIYLGISLETFTSFMPEFSPSERTIIIFDEIQYLANWERHLKVLVDNHPNVKFVASGSAAAALQLKSKESGAGRFSDFMLPPLTFYEFLDFLGEADTYISTKAEDREHDKLCHLIDIDGLNSRFVDYLNYGGYPEAVLNEQIRSNPEQFIKNDIIDKVLLKDLPSLYGINGIQELNKLFSFLAYNAGNEASFENICKESGVTKPTIRRYIEYLESAFLLIKVSTVDDNCKSMKRERNFKIYLNNPSMRAALFAPVRESDGARIGQLAESAIFAQWQHSQNFENLRYARWRNEGEVDIVYMTPGKQKPLWIGEIKWSDRVLTHQGEETKGLTMLLQRHSSIEVAFITSKTAQKTTSIDGRLLYVIPSAAYCYLLGKNIMQRLDKPIAFRVEDSPGQKELELR